MSTPANSSTARIGMLVSHLRQEEKMLLQAGRDRGYEITPIFDRKLVLDLSHDDPALSGLDFDVVLDRGVVHSRASYALRVLERYGIPTVNSPSATLLCDDKAYCTLALEAAGLETPRTMLAFDVDSAIEACNQIGYPAVIKPVVGSWGRLLARVNGPVQARTVFETKQDHGSFHHAIYYVQEFIEKPGRDIRAFVVDDRVVAASYRSSEHWITNTARGAQSTACPITPEIESIALRACAAVGAVLAGVDLIETPDGYSVVEVNTGGEFHGLITTTDVDIPGAIIDMVARIGQEHRERVLAAR